MNELDIFLNVSGGDESSVFVSDIPRKKLDGEKSSLYNITVSLNVTPNVVPSDEKFCAEMYIFL